MTHTITDDEWSLIRGPRRTQITVRQGDIVRLIAVDDLTPPAIARRLGLQLCTVKTQMQRMYKHLGIKNRTSLIVRVWTEWAAMQGWKKHS